MPDKPLVVEYYNGSINADDLIHFKKVISAEADYNLYTNTVVDFRDCDLTIEEGVLGIDSVLNKIAQFLKTNFKDTGTRKVAFLTSKPNEVTLTILYTYILKKYELNFDLNIFSTEKGVADFLGKGILTKEELASIINELKTTPDNVYAK